MVKYRNETARFISVLYGCQDKESLNYPRTPIGADRMHVRGLGDLQEIERLCSGSLSIEAAGILKGIGLGGLFARLSA